MRWMGTVAVLTMLAAASPARAELFVAQPGDARRSEVVASYRGFVVAEASGAAADRLRAAGAIPRDDMKRVALQGRSVDPVREPDGPPGEALLVVQFAGPVKDGWLDDLRATGVRVVTYMAQNAYLVHARPSERAAVERQAAGAGDVRAVFALRAADKVAPQVARDGTVAAQVQTLSGTDGAGARARARAVARRQTRPAISAGPYVTLFVEAPRGALDALAADPGVVAIERDGVLAPEDEVQGQILAHNNLGAAGPNAPGYLAWLRSKLPNAPNPFEFAVDISDTGLDDGATTSVHPDLAGRVAYIDSFMTGPDSTGRDCSGHGSLNAGIAGGFNDTQGSSDHEDAGGYQYGLGIAPWVRLGVTKMLESCGGEPTGTFEDLTSNAYAKGARIVNNSWGTDISGAPYSAVSQAFDYLVRDAQENVPGNQEMVEVKSAGNRGFLGPKQITPPGTAKNLITVGATENVRAFGQEDAARVPDSAADNPRERVGFSSLGPTADERVKPELMAPGTHVAGGRSQATAGFLSNGVAGTNTVRAPFNSFYTASSGTSHSAPAVAGAAALVRQFFSTLPSGAFTPSPAFTKAALVNGAQDLGAGLDNAQGFGLVDLDATLTDANRFDHDQGQRFDNSGETFTRSLRIADPGQAVRLTLAWTDQPGPTTGNAYVNDLDLEVEAGGQTWRGNNITGDRTQPGGVPDARNNVEKIILPGGVGDALVVRVRATNVAGDGVPGVGDATDQDFALTASNTALPPIELSPSGLPDGALGTAYSQAITAAGGAAGAPYVFAVTSGAPPAGLTLSPGGVLSGTPTAPGTATFTVTATDAGGQTATRAYSVTVPAPPPPPPPPPRPVPPLVAGLSLSRSAFTRARGTTLRFRADRAGQVVLRFERRTARGGYRTFATRTLSARAGRTSLRFRGRVGKRTLPVGRYRLTVFGRAGADASRVVRRSFRIVRR